MAMSNVGPSLSDMVARLKRAQSSPAYRGAIQGMGMSGGYSIASSALGGVGTLAGAYFNGVPLVQLVGSLNAADALAYPDNTLPVDGASVPYLKARSFLDTDALQYGSQAAPTFDEDAGGTSMHGLRFTAASSQVMQWPGLINRYNAADMGVTLAAVFRFAAAPSGMQTIFGMNVDGAAQPYRQTIRLKCDASGFYFNAQTGSGTDTFSAAVASAPAQDTTYIAVGRHSTPSGANVNTLNVRVGGSTSTNANANAADLDFNSTGAMTQAFIGAVRRGGTLGEFFNGWFFAGYAWDRQLSDTETAAVIALLRLEWGVS